MENDNFQKALDNAEAQMRKGVLEFAILLAIAERKSYASDLIARLKEARLTVVEGTVYPLLSRLKNSGLLDYSWEESAAGPPRKYYVLTAKGHRFLDGYEKQWQALERAIKDLQR